MVVFSSLVLLACQGTSSDGKTDLVIGVIPALTKGETKRGLDALERHLVIELSMPVGVRAFADYNAVVEAMGFGHIDMAYYGPRTYVFAHAKYGAEALVTQLIDGVPFYYSYLIVPADSLVRDLSDLRGEAVAFGDPASTSGSLMPKLALQGEGIDPDRDIRPLHTGAHDATALAVENRQVAGGFIDSAFFQLLVRQGKVDADKVKVVWQSERLFQYPWATAGGMDQSLRERIRQAFLKIRDPLILNAFGASAFIEAQDADYEVIREAARQFGDIR